ncbi:hypothetical protein FD755_012361 [Muntiacus reevesi]|uniref:Armadillo repeat-containing domain-containing protein n=1 Tax=Muntiacus reevesi TaxID=9886 RepID=A0A5N3XQ01_MUNRE|nr:hypothetical protein FD755_012361 [Muntiacus reevesi]
MGGARDVGWVAAGLVLAAGACYCFYKLTRGRRRGGRRLRLRPSRSAAQVQKVDLPLNWMSLSKRCTFILKGQRSYSPDQLNLVSINQPCRKATINSK